MANEVIEYDKTKRQIQQAEAVEDVMSIRDKMAALVKFFSSKRDPEKERQARELQLLSEARIGEMSLTLKKNPGGGDQYHSPPKAEGAYSKHDTLKSAGITTQQASKFERLAKLPKAELEQAARNGKSAKSVLKKLTPSELEKRGFSRKSERHVDTETDETISRLEAIKRKAKAEGKAEAATEAPIPIDTFSVTVQQKIEAWKRQQLKEMETMFESRVRGECQKLLEETFLPHYRQKESEYEQIVKARKGIMTRAAYNKIRTCLHPDSRGSVSSEKLAEAFRLFNDLELLLVGEKEHPTSGSFKMPSTVAEMMAMRKKKSAVA